MAISDLSNIFIQWPTHEEQDEIALSIEERSHIQNCVGFIDGTHIRLSSAPGGERDYINRKKYASVQLQLVVDDRLLIRDIYVGWPGCTHDARVYRNSPLARAIEDDGGALGPDKFIIGL